MCGKIEADHRPCPALKVAALGRIPAQAFKQLPVPHALFPSPSCRTSDKVKSAPHVFEVRAKRRARRDTCLAAFNIADGNPVQRASGRARALRRWIVLVSNVLADPLVQLPAPDRCAPFQEPILFALQAP